MKRKLVSMLLCAAMLGTLVVGCGKKEEGGGDEPMHISVASYFMGPVDEEKDDITPEVERILREKHGINVELEPVYIEQANYGEILNTRLTGGTAPDVFLAQSPQTLQNYYDNGVIKTWSEEFFKENAPDVYEFIMNGGPHGNYADYVDLWKKISFRDDEMIICAAIKPESAVPWRQLIYRGDWLENLGVTEDQLPKTVDEFVDLMYRFAKEDPDGNGQDDTYGCSVTALRALFGAYGMTNGFISSEVSSFWHEQEDGTLMNEDISDNAKEVIKIARQMYEDGVIDPEFVTGSESIAGAYWAVSNGFVNGRYGVSALAGIDHYRLKGVTGPQDAGGPCAQEYWGVNGEDATFVYGPWPAGPDGDYGNSIGIPIEVQESAVYNADMSDEKLAVIFQILNAFATDDELYMLERYGVEGEHYTLTEQDSVAVNGEKYDAAGLNEVGVGAVRSLYGFDRAFSDRAYDLAFYNEPAIANRLEWLSKDQYDSYMMNAVYEVLPSESDLAAEVNTYRDETWVKMITGELDPEADWDAFVTQYLSIGGQTLMDEANEWYEANKLQ